MLPQCSLAHEERGGSQVEGRVLPVIHVASNSGLKQCMGSSLVPAMFKGSLLFMLLSTLLAQCQEKSWK